MPLALFLPFQPFKIGCIRLFITDQFGCNTKGSLASNFANLDADCTPVPVGKRLRDFNLCRVPLQQFGQALNFGGCPQRPFVRAIGKHKRVGAVVAPLDFHICNPVLASRRNHNANDERMRDRALILQTH
ncbi:MAG: hypothetical protein SF123_08565 [Chloroflexota bacterium]|nr:hypothetical protein [Chloroflexota bacterium]